MKKLLTLLTMALIAINANAQAVIGEIDWTQMSEWDGSWYSTDYATVTVEQGTGLIIENTSDGTYNYWEPQVPIISHIPELEEGGNYLVHIELESPCAGELRLDLYSWDGSGATMSQIIEVVEGYNDMDIDFPDYPTPCTDAGIFYQCGKLPGRHTIKNVQVIDLEKVENWTVAGDKIILGTDWDANNRKNRMYTRDCENYTLTKSELALSKGTYQFKVFKDNSTNISYPSDNASLVINEDGIYDVKFTFNANTKNLTAIATKIEVWTIAGDENLLGVNWDATAINNIMRIVGENYTLIKKDLTLPRGTYQFKVFKDFAQTESYPRSNASLIIEEDATYTIKFTFNSKTKELSATATKTDGLFFNYIPKGKVAELIQNPKKYKGTVIIPSTVIHNGETYSVTKIADNAFSNCSGLTSVTIPNSVTTIGGSAFSGCSKLSSIAIPNSVTNINNYTFFGCSSLASVNIPNSVTTIEESAFSGCSKLNSIAIPNSVTTIGESAFSSCSKLSSIAIPNSVTNINNYTFFGCSSLASVNIANSVTSIGYSAFSDCKGLTTVTIPNSVTSISSNAFSNCTSLTSVNIPNSVTSIGSNAFQNCTGLTSVNIPSSVTSLSGFSGCTGLTSITIPNSVTSINSYAFSGCTGLTSVTIPNSVSWINDYAFQGCSKLKSVTIGNNVKSISYAAFANCSELTDVYCMAEKLSNEQWGNEGLYTAPDAFNESYIEYATLHVPAAALNNYKNTEPWKKFQNKIALDSGDIPETPKCAKPEISYENGRVKFTCETKGVEYISEVKLADEHKYYDAEIQLSQTYKVSVYATKAGYENSDVATREIVIKGDNKAIVVGDVDGDGKVNVADHVKLSEIIMNK